jgi:hypothetical protein
MQTIENMPVPQTAARSVPALLTVFAILALGLSPGTAMAGARWRQHHWHPRTADISFTKWVVTLPASPSTKAGVQMAGVVGGDLGRGLYRGRVASDYTVPQPGYWCAHVRYDLFGRDHWLIADLHVVENERQTPVSAAIRGIVTAGWLTGAQVTGEYARWNMCPIPTPGNAPGGTCFVGTHHLHGVLWDEVQPAPPSDVRAHAGPHASVLAIRQTHPSSEPSPRNSERRRSACANASHNIARSRSYRVGRFFPFAKNAVEIGRLAAALRCSSSASTRGGEVGSEACRDRQSRHSPLNGTKEAA